MNRVADIERKTQETEIALALQLDQPLAAQIETGVGFLDHMLDLFARHARVGLQVQARGDLQVDQHHTVEDVGIVLGQALRAALGDKRGIRRYGHFTLPMDETLVTTALDLSGRHFFVFNVAFPTDQIGTFDTQLVEEFWQAFSANAACNLHVLLHHGRNSHHISEAIFKSVARSLRMAISSDGDPDEVPSTKGIL